MLAALILMDFILYSPVSLSGWFGRTGWWAFTLVDYFNSTFMFNKNCLLETHFTQRYWTGSFLNSAQFTEIGVRIRFLPQAVFDAHPVPLLFKCVTRMMYVLSLIRSGWFVRQTNDNTKKHIVLIIYNYFLSVFPSFDKNVFFNVILIQFEDGRLKI